MNKPKEVDNRCWNASRSRTASAKHSRADFQQELTPHLAGFVVDGVQLGFKPGSPLCSTLDPTTIPHLCFSLYHQQF